MSSCTFSEFASLQVQLRPQINTTVLWLSNPISFLLADEQKKSEFFSENDTLLRVNVPYFDNLK